LLEIICLEAASTRRRLAQGRNKNYVAAAAGFISINWYWPGMAERACRAAGKQGSREAGRDASRYIIVLVLHRSKFDATAQPQLLNCSQTSSNQPSPVHPSSGNNDKSRLAWLAITIAKFSGLLLGLLRAYSRC
jgi:hypothetical protein